MPAPNAIDFEKFLRFFCDMYAHDLTLQGMFERRGEVDLTEGTYRNLRPRHDRFAELEFQIFFQALNDPKAFGKAVGDFLAANRKRDSIPVVVNWRSMSKRLS